MGVWVQVLRSGVDLGESAVILFFNSLLHFLCACSHPTYIYMYCTHYVQIYRNSCTHNVDHSRDTSQVPVCVCVCVCVCAAGPIFLVFLLACVYERERERERERVIVSVICDMGSRGMLML